MAKIEQNMRVVIQARRCRVAPVVEHPRLVVITLWGFGASVKIAASTGPGGNNEQRIKMAIFSCDCWPTMLSHPSLDGLSSCRVSTRV